MTKYVYLESKRSICILMARKFAKDPRLFGFFNRSARQFLNRLESMPIFEAYQEVVL